MKTIEEFYKEWGHDKHYMGDEDNWAIWFAEDWEKHKQEQCNIGDVSKSNSIDIETLSAKVFMLANELAIAGYGNAAVKLHTVHNGMITKGHYYSC